MQGLRISKLGADDGIPYELIHLADDSSGEAVEDYLSRGECWIARVGEDVVGEFILLPTRPFTVELVNIAVHPDLQRRGIGKAMIVRAADIAREKGYKTMEIGTGDCGVGQLALYQQCGFEVCGVDRDFFRRLYPETLFEDGIPCRDMVRLRLVL